MWQRESRTQPFIIQDIRQSWTNQRNRMNPLRKCCNLIKKPPKVPQTRVTKHPSFVFSSTDWWIWKRNLWIWRKIFKYSNCFKESYTTVYQDHLSAVSALFFLNSPKKNKASCFLRLPLPFTQAATLLWMFVKILDISGVFLRFCLTFIHLSLTHECRGMTLLLIFIHFSFQFVDLDQAKMFSWQKMKLEVCVSSPGNYSSANPSS